jgi:hypothetical protein
MSVIVTGVRTVIANSKGLDLDEILDTKKMSDLNFSDADCIALENAINLYFYNTLKMVFDRLLEGPDDIKASQTVKQVIAVVQSVHPRRRA